VVVTGGAVVAAGQTAGDVIAVDGPVTIAGHRHRRRRLGERPDQARRAGGR
jgi:hypothetical protein